MDQTRHTSLRKQIREEIRIHNENLVRKSQTTGETNLKPS